MQHANTKCPSTDDWINEVDGYMLAYYSIIKKEWKEGSLGVGEWAVQATGRKPDYQEVSHNTGSIADNFVKGKEPLKIV